jgi:uncharacterized membrane protein
MTTDAVSATPAKNIAESERAVSAIGGAIIAGIALGQRNASTPFLLLLGGLLIYRGVSGHCALYERLGIDTSDRPSDSEEGPEGMVWAHV